MSLEPLKLKQGIIYGPVNSRRLGSSLGLNILPFKYKACPFNCVYCQYGYTGKKGHTFHPDETLLPSIDEISFALKGALKDYPLVSYITFSGNGEPTIHPRFTDIVDQVKKIRNSFNPDIRLSILSNSALVNRNEVREGLMKLDARFMKLDVGDEELFLRYNRPLPEIRFAEILCGLKSLNDIIIQSLFAGGPNGNVSGEAIPKWIDRIGEIRPRECHIYSLDRPSADRSLVKLGREYLEQIRSDAEFRTGVPVRVFERE